MNQNKEDCFPLKLAQGEQLCNRVAERKFLKSNVEMARYTAVTEFKIVQVS